MTNVIVMLDNGNPGILDNSLYQGTSSPGNLQIQIIFQMAQMHDHLPVRGVQKLLCTLRQNAPLNDLEADQLGELQGKLTLRFSLP